MANQQRLHQEIGSRRLNPVKYNAQTINGIACHHDLRDVDFGRLKYVLAVLAMCLCLPLMGADREKKTLKRTKAQAEKGNRIAQTHLGYMYANGQGVEQDFKEAVKWYQKAADQGHALAQTHLGNMYAVGNGVPKDFKEAVKWYRKAAEQGDVEAQSRLERMYAKGNGVKKPRLRKPIKQNPAEQGSWSYHPMSKHILGQRPKTVFRGVNNINKRPAPERVRRRRGYDSCIRSTSSTSTINRKSLPKTPLSGVSSETGSRRAHWPCRLRR